MPDTANPHTVIIGAGAVGGYVGAHLARAGFNITFVDAWPEHVEKISEHLTRISYRHHTIYMNSRSSVLEFNFMELSTIKQTVAALVETESKKYFSTVSISRAVFTCS